MGNRYYTCASPLRQRACAPHSCALERAEPRIIAASLTAHHQPEEPTVKKNLLLSIVAGLVLDTVTRGRREMKLLAYLSELPLSGK